MNGITKYSEKLYLYVSLNTHSTTLLSAFAKKKVTADKLVCSDNKPSRTHPIQYGWVFHYFLKKYFLTRNIAAVRKLYCQIRPALQPAHKTKGHADLLFLCCPSKVT